MSDDTLIRVESVSKKFCRSLKRSLWYGVQDIGTELLGRAKPPELRRDEFWAVDDVNFELRRGECLGLIGHNGAGKSTLLKMLNGLIKPDKGRISMQGRVGALIELGTGFNPILTGRENIYNNGAVLGFTKKEIDQKFDAIVEFSEIGDFLDTPVQNYSSGMKVRLGFAVAAQMEPDILLIDEVLAVGDMSFVLKCINLLDKLLQKSAMILVSHNIPQIARTTTQIMLMDKGRSIVHSSDVPFGISEYYNRQTVTISDYKGAGQAELLDLRLKYKGVDYRKDDNLLIEYGDGLQIEIDVLCKEKVYEPVIYLAFYDRLQRGFAEIMNFRDYIQIPELIGRVSFSLTIPYLPFSPGKYSLSIGFSDKAYGTIFRNQSAVYFTIHGKAHGWTSVQFSPEWKVERI
jgi:lipopolysaccharide transport system ATP-binding protein